MQSEDGRFNWQRMGQADYSRCAALVASLPPEVRHQLNSSEHGVLTQILYLCWLYASKSGRGAAYCIPSESYLAQAIGRSVRTVRRCLVALREFGLIEVTWRRPIRQTWLTNLYGIGKRMLAVIYASAGKKLQSFQRGTLSSHNDLKKGIEDANLNGASSDSTVLPNDTPAPPSASSGLGQDADAAPRKSLKDIMAELTAAGKMKPQREKPVEVAPETDRRAMLLEQARRLKERGL